MENGTQKELDWISVHRKEVGKFSGKWIAILNNEILASGDSVANVMSKVKQRRVKNLPLVTKVPRKDEEMYIL